MQTVGIVIALTLFAVAMIPLIAWYYLWLARRVLPRLLDLPAGIARTALAVTIALPWILAALVAWAVRR
ncbi:MAG: hypothetical protein M3173_09575 [Chloroflexota bacterium]|nr:hypothetical protein [Chloroflexota bacterium]